MSAWWNLFNEYLPVVGPPLAALFVSLCWPFAAHVWSETAKRRTPVAVNLVRVMVGMPVYLAISFAYGAPDGQWFHVGEWADVRWINVMWLSASVFCTFALADVLFLRSVNRIGLPLAVAITSCYPVWSAVTGVLFLGQWLDTSEWAGLLAVVAGLSALAYEPLPGSTSGASGGQPRRRERRWRSVRRAAYVSFLWGFATFCIAKGGATLNPPTTSAIEMFLALIFCPLFARWMGVAWRDMRLNRDQFLAVLPACVLGIAMNLAYVYCLTRGVLAVSAALSSLSPVFALGFAIIAGYERFSWRRAAWTTLVVVGIVTMVVG